MSGVRRGDKGSEGDVYRWVKGSLSVSPRLVDYMYECHIYMIGYVCMCVCVPDCVYVYVYANTSISAFRLYMVIHSDIVCLDIFIFAHSVTGLTAIYLQCLHWG